jgi:hypothetical protein
MRQRALGIEVLEDRTVPATFTVSTLFDGGEGSLRTAIQNANNASGADVIEFNENLTGVITLTGQIQISDDVNIVGNGIGAGGVEVNGNDAGRIFEVSGDPSRRLNVTISGLTLSDGDANAGGPGLKDGGAILSLGPTTLTITDSLITSSRGSSGGGVAAIGIDNDLIIERTKILNNETTGVLSKGGAVFVFGRDFQFIDSTADGNFAVNSGGGIAIASDTAVIRNSTISRNTAGGGGGGGVDGGLDNVVSIINSTIAENRASGGFSGGGVLALSTMSISNSTIVRNVDQVGRSGVSGVKAFIGSHVSITSSIVAENGDPQPFTGFIVDVGGTFASGGNNLIGNSTGSTGWIGTDILDVPSNMLELTNNGGPTQTILPEAASFANGNGSNPLGLQFDQRGEGFPRNNGKIDIGAVTGDNATVSPGTPPSGGTGGGGVIRGLDDDEETPRRSEGYIRALYITILGREADVDGLADYTQALRNGDSREDIARSIWTSYEHRTLQVAGYYQDFLGRPGTAAEIDSWATTMVDGATEEEVIISILTSDEYRSRFATDNQYVAQLYRDLLGRPAGAAEIESYTSSLDGGAEDEDVVESILTSPEARVLQLRTMYEQQLLRRPSEVELVSYQHLFGDLNFITEVGVELAASDEMFSLGAAFAPEAA